MQGRDLVAIASTGSGKTAGFLLPAFMHIQQQQRLRQEHAQAQGLPASDAKQQGGGRGGGALSRWNKPGAWGAGAAATDVLVLAPTRELAQQIQQEAERLSGSVRIRSA